MKCPKCNSDNIFFVEKILRANFLVSLLFEVLFIILALILMLNNIFIISGLFILGAIINPVVYKIVDLCKRRKSRTKAICKDCEYSWYTKF